MNKIKVLREYGQSIWLDFISRSLLTSGELKRLIDEGVAGMTSNPSIFQKSICETGDYDEIIQNISFAKPGISIPELYEKIAVEDIRMAADILLPVYNATGGQDGFVSFEVSPDLAYQTDSTISEARRLWKLIDRPNLMIKVPATREGIPAIEELTAQGLNINATLIFSVQQYEAVAYAYIHGLERNANPAGVASVASFFVSRIDTAVDSLLEQSGDSEALESRGKTAVAYAKMAYRRLNEIFHGSPFAAQNERGARVQRMVWGSTGTKNPHYSDVLYVDEIIGPDTVNTLPMHTLKAFLDHGKPRLSLNENIKEAEDIINKLREFNINLPEVTKKLEKDGVQSFAHSYSQLLDSLKGRCQIE